MAKPRQSIFVAPDQIIFVASQEIVQSIFVGLDQIIFASLKQIVFCQSRPRPPASQADGPYGECSFTAGRGIDAPSADTLHTAHIVAPGVAGPLHIKWTERQKYLWKGVDGRWRGDYTKRVR